MLNTYTRRRWMLIGLVPMQLALAADGPSAPAAPRAGPAMEASAVQSPQSPPPSGRATRSAVEQLERYLAIDAGEIAVVRAEAVVWPDGGLGCPEPGMRYKQMRVEGSFVQLRVDGKLYNFHGAGAAAPRLCQSKDEVLPENLRRDAVGGDPRS
jgi:hypothetical protein